MKTKLTKTIKLMGIAALLGLNADAAQYKMGDQVIHAKISYQNLNRLKAKNDKIDIIAGLESAFHFEKNQKTGDVYIRPTEDNGYSPISVSVTTASGKTQDLLLEVVDGESRTIELVDEEYKKFDDFSDDKDSEDIDASDYEGKVCQAMKKLINIPENYPTILVKARDRKHLHITATLKESYLIDGFIALKYRITSENKENKPSVLDERMFVREGDVCLSLSSFEITNNTVATLYVLRRY